ncbi:DUF3850 domain-containing protein [uncultured Eubacterium sp.]|uniref:DUF3850 domain-containing protein n=1 Tax=uncultured Eubacterium sp. TaxID=165185 RepID=UPI0026732903|nr:DUF3850 domain-containing protein [uncultured Eubacterium sp.]
MIHELKIEDDYALKVVTNEKTFEIRFNDRDYKKGDYIRFLPVGEKFRNIVAAEIKDKIYKITYVLTHEDFPKGIKEDYAVIAIKEATLQEIRNETAQQ